jgi:CHASE3 domain sensor protein
MDKQPEKLPKLTLGQWLMILSGLMNALGITAASTGFSLKSNAQDPAVVELKKQVIGQLRGDRQDAGDADRAEGPDPGAGASAGLRRGGRQPVLRTEAEQMKHRRRRWWFALLEGFAKYVLFAWLILVGAWVYSLKTFAKSQILSIQNRQVAASLFSDVKDAESGQRGYLLTHNQEYLPQYLAAVRSARSDMRVLIQYSTDRPAEKETLRLLNQEISKKLDELGETIALGQAGNWKAAQDRVNTGEGLRRMERIRDLFDVLRAQESDLLRKAQSGIL